MDNTAAYCYYPTIENYLGEGSGGITYKGSCYRSDSFDALFTVTENQKFVRKKFHDKQSFDYEQYHRKYLRDVYPQWLSNYFCKILRSFSITVNHYEGGCGSSSSSDKDDVEKTFYTDLEFLSIPKWKLLTNVTISNFGKMVDNGQFFKALIIALLDLHYNCHGATYFDVNPNNIFVNYLLWIEKRQVEIKFIDYGGLFHESWIDDYSAFIANPYFLPQPGLSEKISDQLQPNMLALVKSQEMLPVFYSVVCSVSMILDMLDKLEDSRKFFEVILDGMGQKNTLKEQAVLFCDIRYQTEFITYLYNHMDDMRLINKIPINKGVQQPPP